jgi:hypothetical protein
VGDLHCFWRLSVGAKERDRGLSVGAKERDRTTKLLHALVQQQGLLVLAAILFVGFWRCSQQHLLLLLSLTFQ